MKLEELQGMLKTSEAQTKVNRFDLEEAIMDCYRIINDLSLSLDHTEREAAIAMHTMRCDRVVDVFDSLVMQGDIK